MTASNQTQQTPWHLSRDTRTLPGWNGEYRQILNESSTILGFIAVAHPLNDEIDKHGEAHAALLVRAVNSHDALVKAATRALNVFKAQGESVRDGAVTGALADAIALAKAGVTP